MNSEFDINQLEQEAQSRWLKPAEVLFILKNHESYQITEAAPQKPPSGSLFLYDKRLLKFFRKDGHMWRKKKNGRTVGEGHERLKVGNVEALNCYYAHGEQNPNFQRRSYWMLDPMFEHIVLVHYREVHEGRVNSGSTLVSAGCPSVPDLGFNPSQNQSPISTNIEPYQTQSSFSPGSFEVSSELFTMSHGRNLMDETQKTGEFGSSHMFEITCAPQRIEEQLSLNINDIAENSLCSEKNLRSMDLGALKSNQDEGFPLAYGSEYRDNYQSPSGTVGVSDMPNWCPFYPNPGEYTTENQESSIWEEMPVQCLNSSWLSPQCEVVGMWDLEQNVRNSGSTHGTISSCDQLNHPGVSLGTDSRSTLEQKQRFTIQEISPEWGYDTDSTKVIITGSFLYHPSEYAWSCMFGDIEVPVQIIQEGVLRCQAPPHIPGKVTLCITSSNREPCSELKEFEYRIKPDIADNCSSLQRDVSRSTQELLLLVQLAKMLLCDPMVYKENNGGSVFNVSRIPKADADQWEHITEALLVGSKSPLGTMDWLLQEFLKDKLQHWLASKYMAGDNSGCSLSKKEQGVIHMVAGLGFEWALNPILNSGVNVNYRDVNGWTALHWAARHGREKMVAALIASGATAAAVTDPTSQDPVGKTPASIAEACGHKGLAGYLSEVALTSHLSALTLEESNEFKVSAAAEAERIMETISAGSQGFTEDQLSLKDSLAAVRNATLAAKRIQSAFRAHSFRKRQLREAAAAYCDEYGITLDEICGLPDASQLSFPRLHDYILNKAALSIQKKYRGWKGRQYFLALRQKIVLIQAYVRGYQARKMYKMIIWAVGVIDKVVLRWHRKRVGLRGFQPDRESADEIDYEGILKVFQRQKVDAAIEESLSQVLSIVKSPEARQQYRRMLENYWQAKGELFGEASEGASFSQGSGDRNNIEELCNSHRSNLGSS